MSAQYSLTDTDDKIRNFYSFFFRYLLNRRPIPRNVSLFEPTIWTSSTPLAELDIMGHKSNSTYLSDLDFARTYHLCSLFRAWSKPGLTLINPQKRKETKPFYPVVGAVSCTFRKPIWPMQEYDIVTRVLSWDRKWMYLISHFVKKDAFKPRYFSDQPTRNKANITPDTHDDGLPRRENGRNSDSAVLAMSVTKIVFKEARNTVPPANFLRDCGYLTSESGNAKTFCTETQGNGFLKTPTEQVEERRLMGLRVAEKLNVLDEGSSFFDSEEQIAYSKF